MPNQTQVQTYDTCNQATFPSVLQRYWEALSRLGCTDQQVRNWLTHISWPVSEDDTYGDVYAAPVTIAPALQRKLPVLALRSPCIYSQEYQRLKSCLRGLASTFYWTSTA